MVPISIRGSAQAVIQMDEMRAAGHAPPRRASWKEKRQS